MKRTIVLLTLLLTLQAATLLPAQTATSTWTTPVLGALSGSCPWLTYCTLALEGTPYSLTWPAIYPPAYDWMTFSYTYNAGLFCPNSATLAGSNPITASCSASSPEDGTPYTMTATYSWQQRRGCGRGGCRTYYVITGGTFSLTASEATLHALGVPGY